MRTQSGKIIVADVESHYAHTQAEGGKIIEKLLVAVYGENQYGVEDLDGHVRIVPRMRATFVLTRGVPRW